MSTQCYLVYRSVNGKVTAEIQYGQHQTGEGVKTDNNELKRIVFNKIYLYK